MYFLKYWLQKIWLEKLLKIRVSEDLSTDNKGNGSKNWSDLNDTTFTIFIIRFDSSCIGESLF